MYETSISKIYGLSAFNQEPASLGCQRTVARNTRKQSDCHRTTSYITCIIHYVWFVYPEIFFSFCLDQFLFLSNITLYVSFILVVFLPYGRLNVYTVMQVIKQSNKCFVCKSAAQKINPFRNPFEDHSMVKLDLIVNSKGKYGHFE